jgi:hypothetical protein
MPTKKIKLITEELGPVEMQGLIKHGLMRFVHIYKKIDEIIIEINKLNEKAK